MAGNEVAESISPSWYSLPANWGGTSEMKRTGFFFATLLIAALSVSVVWAADSKSEIEALEHKCAERRSVHDMLRARR
jgi:hypothetical protein